MIRAAAARLRPGFRGSARAIPQMRRRLYFGFGPAATSAPRPAASVHRQAGELRHSSRQFEAQSRSALVHQSASKRLVPQPRTKDSSAYSTPHITLRCADEARCDEVKARRQAAFEIHLAPAAAGSRRAAEIDPGFQSLRLRARLRHPAFLLRSAPLRSIAAAFARPRPKDARRPLGFHLHAVPLRSRGFREAGRAAGSNVLASQWQHVPGRNSPRNRPCLGVVLAPRRCAPQRAVPEQISRRQPRRAIVRALDLLPRLGFPNARLRFLLFAVLPLRWSAQRTPFALRA